MNCVCVWGGGGGGEQVHYGENQCTRGRISAVFEVRNWCIIWESID